jgi:hypothetical protein
LKALKQYSQLTNDQLGAIEFFKCNSVGGLFASVGTGKTVSALTAAKWLLDRYDVRRILVIGPRLIAERVWSDEAAEWDHLRGLTVAKVIGTAPQRLKALASSADIYTISRDNLVWLESLFIDVKARRQTQRWPFDLVIVDECQSFKSQSSKRFKSLRRLRRLFSRCWLLTGSLLPNGYEDAWSQMYLVDGGARLGKAEGAYHQAHFKCEVRDGIPRRTLLPGHDKDIDALIAQVFHVVRDAQPPAPTNFIRVALSDSEKKLYKQMVRSSVLSLGDEQITAVNAGVLFGKLAQLANGAVYDVSGKWHTIHDQKLEALKELLEGLPRPLLIGYSYVHDVERIRCALSDVKDVGVIRTPQSLEEWKSGKIKVGIIHPASAGHGLNDLQNAETVVWFGMTPNLEYYQQLNGRVIGGHRRAGRDICVHHLLTEGTIDEELKDMLDFKDEQQVAAQIRIAHRLVEELRT